MGQKVNPVGFRVGIYREPDAEWFDRVSYADALLEDLRIRKFLDRQLARAEVARIKIEKAAESVRVVVFCARPGVAIGRQGRGVESLREHLSTMLGKNVEVSVQEVRNPELQARIVGQGVADQISGRKSYKKAMKRAAASVMRSGAQGVRITISGRLGGAEIARSEKIRLGSVPLHTLRSDIDYALSEAQTTYGIIGVKVWICRGDFKRTVQ